MLNTFRESNAGYGILLFRILVGARLIYGVQDNIFSWAQMVEFEHFLAARNVPWPLLGAVLSVYTQFICGILIALGALTPYAAIAQIINFIAALYIAHRGDTFAGMFPALTMLSAGFLLLLDGPGKISVDAWFKNKRRKLPAVR